MLTAGWQKASLLPLLEDHSSPKKGNLSRNRKWRSKMRTKIKTSHKTKKMNKMQIVKTTKLKPMVKLINSRKMIKSQKLIHPRNRGGIQFRKISSRHHSPWM